MSSMMKALIVIPTLSGGGAEAVATLWKKSLTAVGHDVQVHLTHPPASDDGEEVPVDGAIGFVRSILRLRKRLKNENFDVVLGLMPYSNLILIFSALTISRAVRPAVVISEHNLHYGLGSHLGRAFRFQLYLARRYYRLANAVICVSHAVGAEISAVCRIPRSRLWIIANPAAEMGGPKRIDRDSVDQFETLSIVVPGRLVAQKRPGTALLVATEIATKLGGPATTVHYFGSGPLEPQLRETATELQVGVVFHGWVDRWFDQIPPDGVVLLASSTEGFGNVLIEAAMRAVPSVVSSRSLGAGDAVIPNISAVLTADDNVTTYARGVLRAREISIPDLSDWLSRFTTKQTVTVLEACLTAAIDDRKSV